MLHAGMTARSTDFKLIPTVRLCEGISVRDSDILVTAASAIEVVPGSALQVVWKRVFCVVGLALINSGDVAAK